MPIQQSEAIKLISNGIRTLYCRDGYLIDKKVHERTVTNRLSIYLHEAISTNAAFADYVVDCEYNKSLDDPKKIADKLVVPDIIIHQRGSMDYNAIVIEAKPYWGKKYRRVKDKSKIDTYAKLGYKNCLYIEFLKQSFSINGQVTQCQVNDQTVG